MGDAETGTHSPSRIASIDQFRGYAIAGMILVNFLGQFAAIPAQFKHHSTYMTYADTIAPVFIFVVGMGFRLSFMRRSAAKGPWRARWDAAKRYSILTIVGIVFYGGPWTVVWWDALTDIGIAGLLAIPFIDKPRAVRVVAATAYLALYQALFTWAGYGAWTMKHSIDGGPLGPLSWAFILLFGSLAYDAMAEKKTEKTFAHLLGWGLALCVAGLALRAEWPGVKEFWYFTQKGMTAPYPVYSMGLAFLTLLAFYFASDGWGWQVPTFTVMGMNPLILYLVHSVIMTSNQGFFPTNSPVWKGVLAFTLFYALCYAVARRLYNDRVVIKL